MITYNKIVRDRIPEIIRGENKKLEFERLEGRELIELLNEKLREEITEYLEDESLEELADLVQVVYGILEARGVSLEEFESIRNRKLEDKGGFSQGYKLIRAEL